MYSAREADFTAEGDRLNCLSFTSGAIITGGAIVLQGSMQTLFDAITQLANFDILLVYMQVFLVCLAFAIYFSHQCNLFASNKKSFITSSWPWCLDKIRHQTRYLVVLILCSIFAAGAQSSFSIAVISRFRNQGDGALTGIVIVSFLLVVGATLITGVGLMLARRLFFHLPLVSNALANPLPYPARAFGMAATSEARIVDDQFDGLFTRGK